MSSKHEAELRATAAEGALLNGSPVHPLRVIYELEKVITPETTLCLDVGRITSDESVYESGAFSSDLMSNGQQTLGVALPWAIASGMVHQGQPVISIWRWRFLFTATELETAVRMGSRFVHLIWNSHSYNMVEFQEQAHYGRVSGIELGHYDVVKFAESFGCIGYNVESAELLGKVLQDALRQTVPVLINIPIDYSENSKLMKDVEQAFIH